jgi:hypothetical protein
MRWKTGGLTRTESSGGQPMRPIATPRPAQGLLRRSSGRPLRRAVSKPLRSQGKHQAGECRDVAANRVLAPEGWSEADGNPNPAVLHGQCQIPVLFQDAPMTAKRFAE